MTEDQSKLRAALERVASLANNVGKLEWKLEKAKDELASAMYEIQQKGGGIRENQ